MLYTNRQNAPISYVLLKVSDNMKIFFKKDFIFKNIPILAIAVVAAILNILHVIIGLAKTPPGQVYLATGHYYLDYYEYVQAISQGIRGRWLPINYFTLEQTGIELRYWPYTIIGRFFSIFNLSAISAYWASVVVFTIILIVLIHIAIRRILKDRPYRVQILGFLIALFSCYFYIIVRLESGYKIVPFALWYHPDNFFSRFNVVPYHLLATILILLIILKISNLFEKLQNLSKLKVIVKSLLIGTLIGLVLSFQPLSLITFFCALAIFCLYFMLRAVLEKKTENLLKIIIFATVVLIISLPAALIVKLNVGATAVGQGIASFELNFSRHPPPILLLLSLGPVFIFSLFGLRSYFKDKSSLRILILIFTISSYALYISNVDRLLGTHNGRFLSPLSYILFGSLAALGIESLASFFRSGRKIIFVLLSSIFLIYFIPPTVSKIQTKLNDKDLFSPITYLPEGIVDGFKLLENDNSSASVLTYPDFFLGILIPVFTDKKVYIARSPMTLDWTRKANLTTKFYLGAMSQGEAKIFLRNNRIGFAIITSIEGLSWPKFYKYTFLKEIYRNSDIIIFKAIEK